MTLLLLVKQIPENSAKLPPRAWSGMSGPAYARCSLGQYYSIPSRAVRKSLALVALCITHGGVHTRGITSYTGSLASGIRGTLHC